MRVVIYDAEDMEPITVVKLPPWVIELAERGQSVTVPVLKPITAGWANEQIDLPRTAALSQCRLKFDCIMKGNERMMWICTTMDGESALLLRSVFLPGQQSALNEERSNAFLDGLMAAMGTR